MKSIKENLEAFTAPVKQEKENNGCLWTVIKWVFILSIVCAILSQCSSTPEDNKPMGDPVATTLATEKRQHSDELTESTQATAATTKPTQATTVPTETTDGIQLSFLENQIQYANKYKISLHRFPAEEANLANWLNSTDSEVRYVSPDNIFGADQYKLTERYDGFLYCGQLKNNRPDGYGILLAAPQTNARLLTYENHAFVCRYIGKFSDGRFDGFGVMFTESEEGNAFLSRLRPYNETTGENAADFLTWANYAEYFGAFSDGYKSGLGNHFNLSDSYLGSFENALSKIDLDNPAYSVNVGNYKKDQLNGANKQYYGGYLYYDGESKNDLFDGYGELYYLGTNILSYKGEFKNDQRHGTGTSYSKTGEVTYQGKWKYDDYA